MGIQPTASKSDLLLNCQYPFDPALDLGEPEPPGEVAEYGTDFHWKLHAALQGATPADNHVKGSLSIIQGFMAGENPWGYKFEATSMETPLALRIKALGPARVTWAARQVDFSAEGHSYSLAPGDIGGTADLVLDRVPSGGKVAGAFRVVWDHKTGSGEDYTQPAKKGQMLTLALATDADAVAILHTPRGSIPAVYADPVSPVRLKEHAFKLDAALKRIGDGSLRPGPWCKWCPARPVCPTNNADLAKAGRDLVKVFGGDKLLAEIDLGKVHQLLPAADKLFEQLRAELKERVRAGEVIQRPDGKTLEIQTVTAERVVGKADLFKAFAPLGGEAKARELGLVKSSVQERLVAK
jgi:hypothetical protein